MSMPASELPGSGAESLAGRGVITHLTVGGGRIALIVPASLMDTMKILAAPLSSVPAAEAPPQLLPRVYPWAADLPPHELGAFGAELGDVLREGGPDAPEQMERVVDGWRATAEVYADEGALAALRSPLTDCGTVPEPAVR